MSGRIAKPLFFTAGVGLLMLAISLTAKACPFCGQVSMTWTEEMKAADAVVIAEMTETPQRPAGADSAYAPGISEPVAKSKFRIVEVLKGPDLLKKPKPVEAIYLGDAPVGTKFLITAVDPKALSWSTPTALTDRSLPYIKMLLKLSDRGADRLVFFQNYLEDADQVLKQDSFDEFAKASYDDLKAYGPRANYGQLIKWIQDPDISPSHRRLYFTLLGVCGSEKDVPLIESLFHSKDRKFKAGLDAMIGSYLAIKGPTGMSLVQDMFLKNQAAEFTDTYAAIQAVRISQEAGIVTKDNAAKAFHLMLDRPKMADLVIPDLARWQDWTVLDRLVDLFVKADADSAWVRVPVLKYLQVCPLPEAKNQLTKLQQMDPTAAKQAESFLLPGGAALAPAPVPAGANNAPAAGGAASSNTTSSNNSLPNGNVKKN
ncbi:MAG TPA: hypothetical protein VFE46_19595 [Pirellulales bacterium]|jgi:hypothetical protein|nr:hypothetical protein [Pirellulales bacterium]